MVGFAASASRVHIVTLQESLFYLFNQRWWGWKRASLTFSFYVDKVGPRASLTLSIYVDEVGLEKSLWGLESFATELNKIMKYVC